MKTTIDVSLKEITITTTKENDCNCSKCCTVRAARRAEDPDECPYEEGTDTELSWWLGIFDYFTDTGEDGDDCGISYSIRESYT